MIRALRSLVQEKGRLLVPIAAHRELRRFPKLRTAARPLSKIFLGHRENLVRTLRPGLGELAVITLVDGDPIARDVHEKETAIGKPVVHLAKRVNNEVDGRLERPRDR